MFGLFSAGNSPLSPSHRLIVFDFDQKMNLNPPALLSPAWKHQETRVVSQTTLRGLFPPSVYKVALRVYASRQLFTLTDKPDDQYVPLSS